MRCLFRALLLRLGRNVLGALSRLVLLLGSPRLRAALFKVVLFGLGWLLCKLVACGHGLAAVGVVGLVASILAVAEQPRLVRGWVWALEAPQLMQVADAIVRHRLGRHCMIDFGSGFWMLDVGC